MVGGGWRAARGQARIGGAGTGGQTYEEFKRTGKAPADPFRQHYAGPKKKPKRDRFDPAGWSGESQSRRAQKLKGTKSEYKQPNNYYKGIDGREYGGISESASDPWRRSMARDQREAAERAAEEERWARPEDWQRGQDLPEFSYEDLESRYGPGTRPPGYMQGSHGNYWAQGGEYTPQMEYESQLYDQYQQQRRERSGNYTNPALFPMQFNMPTRRQTPYGGGGSVGSSSSGPRPGPSGGGGGNFGGWSNPYSPGSFGTGYGTGPADALYPGGGTANVPMGGYGWDLGPWGGG